MGLLDGGKKELFGAIQAGGVSNPISGAKANVSARMVKVRQVLAIGGVEVGALDRADAALSRLDGFSGSLTQDIGATLSKVNSAATLMNEYAGMIPEGAAACLSSNKALAVLGEAGQQAIGKAESALNEGVNKLTEWLGDGWEALEESALVTWVTDKLAGTGSGFLGGLIGGALALFDQAGEWIGGLVDEGMAYLEQMESTLRDYVATLQLERFMNHPCYQVVVDNVAAPSVRSALDKVEQIKALT
jgi:hypothetical protein